MGEAERVACHSTVSSKEGQAMTSTDSAMPIGSSLALTLKQPEYSCPVHGNITQHTVQFSLMTRPTKQYCLLCLQDKMVESGVCEVTRIES
jgi:hypothetical protein